MRSTGFHFPGAFVLALALSGCSTTSLSKTPESPALARAQQTSTVGKPSKATTTQPSSSLEANREGKPPAEGPLKDIYFGFDQYVLRPDSRDLLKSHADWLKKNASAQVQIEGHCDDRGTTEYNLALGAKRAQAAKDYLVTLGIPASRITTISYGKELPVCHEENDDCWQRDRHDRFVVKGIPTT